jgi:hypothetical protein
MYLNAVQQFAHAPETVSLDVSQSRLLQAGHVKVLHLLLWRETERDTERQRDRETERDRERQRETKRQRETQRERERQR